MSPGCVFVCAQGEAGRLRVEGKRRGGVRLVKEQHGINGSDVHHIQALLPCAHTCGPAAVSDTTVVTARLHSRTVVYVCLLLSQL